MHRFFVHPDEIKGSTCTITGDDAHHIQRVLRLEAGEKIIICDSLGTDYLAVIRSMDKGQVYAGLLSSNLSSSEPEVKVTLLQGLPKASKMESIIQKCVELGVRDVLPITTARTVVRITDAGEGEKKALRWQRIAEEAAKQCGRGIIPGIHTPVSYEYAIRSCQSDLKILLWEEEKENSLRRVLQSQPPKPASIAVLIGPEGGLEKEETDMARQHGWIPVTLGSRILRTETAGMAALAAIMYQMEELE